MSDNGDSAKLGAAIASNVSLFFGMCDISFGTPRRPEGICTLDAQTAVRLTATRVAMSASGLAGLLDALGWFTSGRDGFPLKNGIRRAYPDVLTR
jgi:hypothetical protein